MKTACTAYHSCINMNSCLNYMTYYRANFRSQSRAVRVNVDYNSRTDAAV